MTANDLSLQRERLFALLSPVTDDEASFRYGPGKWSVKEVVGHITDTERVFSYRLLSVARGRGSRVRRSRDEADRPT